MKKTLSSIALIAVVFTFAAPSYATQNRVPATNTKGGVDVMIPAHVIQKAPGVFSLGSAIDPGSGRLVEGYAIYSHKNGHNPGGGKPGGSTTSSSCYEFLARGAKWKTIEPWTMNPTNSEGLSEQQVFNLMAGGIEKWEDAADGTVGNQSAIEILGVGSTTFASLVADTVSPDGVNEVYFADINSPGAIGVTIVWGIFSGPPQGRELIEWDQVYDQVDFDWATDGDPTKMDFDSIATHELGHSVGLADLYTTECSEETMYGYGVEGETKARSLEAGDIAGVSKLY